MKKAIIKSDRKPINEGTTEYDCDWKLFQPIVDQLNELGAPVTLYDLMELIEGKLTGAVISGKQDPYLVYTLIVDDNKLAKRIEENKIWTTSIIEENEKEKISL